MKKRIDRFHFVKALVNLIIVLAVVVAVVSFFIFGSNWIGPIFFGLGILNLSYMKILGIKIKQIYADLTFGFIDNILLIGSAIIGGYVGGLAGAIIGGAAGNTVADGVSGFFEGYVSEKQEEHKMKISREMLSSSLGKITGCLFGAGLALTIRWVINLIWMI